MTPGLSSQHTDVQLAVRLPFRSTHRKRVNKPSTAFSFEYTVTEISRGQLTSCKGIAGVAWRVSSKASWQPDMSVRSCGMRLLPVTKTSISQSVSLIRPRCSRRSQVVGACAASQMLKGVSERRWLFWPCCSLVSAGSHDAHSPCRVLKQYMQHAEQLDRSCSLTCQLALLL